MKRRRYVLGLCFETDEGLFDGRGVPRLHVRSTEFMEAGQHFVGMTEFRDAIGVLGQPWTGKSPQREVRCQRVEIGPGAAATKAEAGTTGVLHRRFLGLDSGAKAAWTCMPK